MNLFQRYIAYLRDNPERYWFKRKAYGWGWTPARWQGWLVVAIFILFLGANGLLLAPRDEPSARDMIWFFIRIGVAAVALIGICYRTGEKPRWQWGLPPDSKSGGK
jgi:hypothetical protein